MSHTYMSLRLKLQNALASIFDFMSSFDFFISYSRKDRGYTEALAVSLTKKKLHCYVDQWGTTPRASVPQPMKKAIVNSRFLILIGTDRAYHSPDVEYEFNLFAATGKPIVLIHFGATLPKPKWLEHFGLIGFTEPLEALERANPSEAIIATLGLTPKQHQSTRISGALRELLPFKREKSGIFISYRTADTAGFALWIYEKLKSKFWFRPVFLDVATINPGQDWELG